MEWYLSLDINTRINLKGEAFQIMTGVKFQDLSFILSFQERIEIFYFKIKDALSEF